MVATLERPITESANMVTTRDGPGSSTRTGAWGSRSSSATAGRSTPMPGTTSWYFVASNGFRAIAHDRRGHGRSGQAWNGNDMDTYADDLAAVIEELDLRDIVLVGHSTGGGEVTRYIGRHGTSRVAKAVLVGAIPPLMLKTDANPGGLPIEAFDAIRAGRERDRSQFYKDLSAPFYGANRPGSTCLARRARCVLAAEHAGRVQGRARLHRAFSETDFTEDLKRFDVPTLIVHGDDDQIVPIGASALRSSKIVKGADAEGLPRADHGLATTHKERFNADLLAFYRG